MNTKANFIQYQDHLQSLAAQVEHPQHGFFGSGSMAWKVNREGMIAMGALRALLMQVAHPMVAQGIADHSDFRRKPLQRVYKTLHAQQMIVFGNVEQAVNLYYEFMPGILWSAARFLISARGRSIRPMIPCFKCGCMLPWLIR